MNKKEKRLSARQAAEKAVIRDEQNRRLAYAATNSIKDVLNDLHTALSGLDMESVSASRIRHGSNKVTHVKKSHWPDGWQMHLSIRLQPYCSFWLLFPPPLIWYFRIFLCLAASRRILTA